VKPREKRRTSELSFSNIREDNDRPKEKGKRVIKKGLRKTRGGNGERKGSSAWLERGSENPEKDS